MKLARNAFLQGLNDGVPQVGLWLSMGSNVAAEVVAPAGFDWVLIDMEHCANDYMSVLSQLQVFAGTATTPLVRVEWNDMVAVKRVLELGPSGILFPMIQTVEEAKRAVAATRYPPEGVRGFSGATRATKYGRVTDYTSRVNEETAVLLQVETRAAIEIAEDIAAVDGVDGIFFGPADIAADIGKLGQPQAPEVWDLIRPAAARLRDKGVRVGTLSFDAEFAAGLVDEGFNFVACGADTSLLARGSDALIATMRR